MGKVGFGNKVADIKVGNAVGLFSMIIVSITLNLQQTRSRGELFHWKISGFGKLQTDQNNIVLNYFLPITKSSKPVKLTQKEKLLKANIQYIGCQHLPKKKRTNGSNVFRIFLPPHQHPLHMAPYAANLPIKTVFHSSKRFAKHLLIVYFEIHTRDDKK